MEYYVWHLLLFYSICYVLVNYYISIANANVVRIDENGKRYDFSDKYLEVLDRNNNDDDPHDDDKQREEYEKELRKYNNNELVGLVGGYGNVSGFVHVDAGDIEYDIETLRIRKTCYSCYYGAWVNRKQNRNHSLGT